MHASRLALAEAWNQRRTRVAVTSVFDSVEDRDGMLQSGMEQGAGESYDRLEAYLKTLVAQR